MGGSHTIKNRQSLLHAIYQTEQLLLTHLFISHPHLLKNLSQTYRHEFIVKHDSDLIWTGDDLETMQTDDMFALDLCPPIQLVIYFFRQTFLMLDFFLDNYHLSTFFMTKFKLSIGRVLVFKLAAFLTLLVAHFISYQILQQQQLLSEFSSIKYNKKYNMISQSNINISLQSDKAKSTQRSDASYLEKYRKRLPMKQRGNSPMQSVERCYLEEQNNNRGQKIFQFFNSGEKNLQKLKIEQEEEESQLMRNEYLQTELLWFKKIDETKHEIMSTKQMCEKQTKIIKDLEKQLSNKRVKLTQLTQKLRKAVSDYQNVFVQTYEEDISVLTQQYETTFTKGAILINEAKSDRQELLEEIEEEDKAIENLEREIQTFKEYESEHYQGKLSQLLDEEDRLKYEITKMDQQIYESKQELKHIQSTRPIPQENHRKYLQLYQKIFINKNLDVTEQLVKKKQKQIDRLQDYEKKKTLYNLKKHELQQRQTMYNQLKKTQHDLQQQIREKSTILLNLYQYENQQVK